MGPYYDHQVGRFEPPDTMTDVEIYIRQGRRAHAQATAALFGALFRSIGAVVKGVIGFGHYAAYGATKLPPQGNYRSTATVRLTGCSE